MSTDTLTHAINYTEKRHWYLVPIKVGKKRPPMEGWQDLRLSVEDLPRYFNNGAAIGVLLGEPSGNLIDVDLDCDEALRLAPRLLPPTALRHGRPGRPNSHYWYICQPLPDTSKFRDPRKPEAEGMLVEFRGTGCQTLIPPSPHPEGGCYAWDYERDPTHLDGHALLERVAKLAAACLLVRYWPGKGSRQDAALALSGGLLRAGWEQDAISDFVQEVASAAGDEEFRMRSATAKASEKRLDKGGQATGWPTLAEHVGADIVDKVTEWLGITFEADETPIVFSSGRQEPEWPADAAPEAFYGLAGDIVRTLAPYTEADPHALLITLLAAFGNCVGREPHWRVGRDRHALTINAVLVGQTSDARKGMSWNEIRSLFETAAPDWASGCITFGLTSGEGMIHEVRDPVIKREPIKEKGHVTGYQEVMTDEGVSDKRRLAIETEFGATLQVMAREGNILSGVFRKMWDGGDVRTLSKNSPVRTTGAHFSVIGHVTQEDLAQHLDKNEQANGFGNRIVWMSTRRVDFLPFGGDPPEAAMQELAGRLAEAVQFAKSVGEMGFDAQARSMWAEVYRPLDTAKPGLMGRLLGRAAPHCRRLACIYALLNCSATVRSEHLQAALYLWDRAEASVKYVFGNATGDPVADAILRALRSQGPLTKTDISGLFGRNVSAAVLTRAYDLLIRNGLIASEEKRTGGRPAEVWRAL